MGSADWRARAEVVPEAPIALPPLIWQTLFSRGIRTAREVEQCLSPTLKNIRAPLSLLDMDVAVNRMIQAFEKNEKVCIYADFDLDGSSGLALLKTGLEGLGFQNVIGYQPRRLVDGYGVHVGAVREIHDSGVQLMITVDVGITAHEALNEASRLGLDVIVTDHHLPKETLPEALAIVNPNRPGCTSGLGHLAGVGVAFYLFLAVRAALRELGLGQCDFDPKELLDFFVIGTLTDMVPLHTENRALVRHGLWQLTRTKRPGLRALIERLELDGRELTSQDVAMRFAPKLNALSRLESSLRPIDMLLAGEWTSATELAEEVLACNHRRVETQRLGESAARGFLEKKPPGKCIWLWSDQFHRGVVGLIATRLAQELHLPAFIGSLNEKGRIVGSARLPAAGQTSLVDALQSAEDVLERFGGHAQAAGFEVALNHAEALGERLESFFAAEQPRVSRPLYYDGAGDLSEISAEFMKWHESLGPFGADFEIPVYRLKGTRAQKLKELRGGHIRVDLESLSSREKRTCICFGPSQETAELLKNGGPIEVLAEPQWNHYQGSRSLQLILRACRPQG